MNESILIKVIAQMHCDFSTKFGIPRQSGLVKALKGTVVFAPEYRNPDAVRGLEGFSHIWLVWQFSEAVREGWSPTVRPPRMGGNTRMGRVCHALPIPAQRNRPFQRKTRSGGV